MAHPAKQPPAVPRGDSTVGKRLPVATLFVVLLAMLALAACAPPTSATESQASNASAPIDTSSMAPVTDVVRGETPGRSPALLVTDSTTPQSVNAGLHWNPWGYSFVRGKLIYHPAAMFCTYFRCVATFWQNTDGYVQECLDQTFTHMGGRPNACAGHGGNWFPLYDH